MLLIKSVLEGQSSASLDINNSILRCKTLKVNPFQEELLTINTLTGEVSINSGALSQDVTTPEITYALEKDSSIQGLISTLGLGPVLTSASSMELIYPKSQGEYEYFWVTEGTDSLRYTPGEVVCSNGDVTNSSTSFIWKNTRRLDTLTLEKGSAKRLQVYSFLPILYRYYSKLSPKTIKEVANTLFNALLSLKDEYSSIGESSFVSKFVGKSEITFTDRVISKLFDISLSNTDCQGLLKTRIHNASSIAPPTARLEVEEKKDSSNNFVSFNTYLYLMSNEDKDDIEYSINDPLYPSEYPSASWKLYKDRIEITSDYFDDRGYFKKQILLRSSRSLDDPLFRLTQDPLTSTIIAIPSGKEKQLYGDVLNVNDKPLIVTDDTITTEFLCDPSY